MSDREQNTQAARRQIEEFLSGTNADTDLESAVATLRRDDPAWLRDLQQRLDILTGDPVCALVASSLDEYAALGANAAASMPAVASHLSTCDQCREHFALYVGVEREIAAPWRELAQSLASPRLTFRRALKEWTATWTDRIGAWMILSPAPAAVTLAAPRAESRRLLLRLPDAAGALEVTVIPASDADWQIDLRLEPSSTIASLIVGIGDESSAHLGTRDVRHGRDARLPVDPPVDHPYWLHLRWTPPGGEAKSEKFALPVVVEE